MTKNELGGCRMDIPLLPVEQFEEVFAIDANSNDGTAEYLLSQGIPVYNQPTPSLNAAYHYANTIAKTDAVVVFFPKGTIDPKIILSFRPYLESGGDVVIASRMIHGGLNEDDSKFFKVRKWGVVCLSKLAALIWCERGAYAVKDVLHGVKAWKKIAFDEMKISKRGISIDIEMVIRSYRLKKICIEFPVQESGRPHGKTNFKIVPTGYGIAKYLCWELFSSKDRPAKQ
jgi:hypothetical protein